MGLLQSGGSRLIRKKGGGSGGVNIAEGAILAVSSRKIITSYSGNNYSIIRTNDNATTSIGFNGSGDTDSAAITAFVGANTALITGWHNQVDGTLATANTASQRPRIVNAGTIDAINTRPSPRFSADDFLNTSAFSGLADFTLIATFNSSTACNIMGNISLNRQVKVNNFVMSFYDGANNRLSTSTAITGLAGSSYCWRRESGTIFFYQNKINYGSGSGIAGLLDLNTIARTSYGEFINGNVGEILLWNSALSVAEIESKMQSQIDYFSIG